MIVRLLSLCLSGLGLGSVAMADSRCEFETGLLGSTAIGYESPAFLEPYNQSDNRYNDEAAKTCQFLTFDRIGEEGVLTDCDDLVHVPSRYVTDVYRDGLTLNPSASEYFEVQIFDVKDDYLKARLKSGSDIWLKHSGMVFAYQFDDRFPQGHRGIPWMKPHPDLAVSPIFLEPDYDTPDSQTGRGKYQLNYDERWVTSGLAFFDMPVFRLLEALGRFDPSDKLSYVNRPAYDTEFAVQYVVTDFVTAPDGSIWYQADEIMSQGTLWTLERSDIEALAVTAEQSQAFMALLYEVFESEPLRQVYIPYRDPDGTILTVLSEAFCD